MIENEKIPLLVISDGKPGHENQSLGLAERIPDADIMIQRHGLKIGFSETILRLKFLFNPKPSKSTARLLLTYVFTCDIINAIVAHQPKVVIAAGTLSAGTALMAAALTDAKSVICMTPSLIPISRFDLAVIPIHDNPPDKPNIFRTFASPNRVNEKLLSDEYIKWHDEFPKHDDPVISLIIGGPSNSARFDSTLILSLINFVCETAKPCGFSVWLSTSRRTPVDLEYKIEELLSRGSELEWKLLWHKDQRNPLYAMFHRSRLSIVTSDSVSMVAESSSSGVPTIAFMAHPETNPSSKQMKMLSALESNGYIHLTKNFDEIRTCISKAIQGSLELKTLDETDKAARKIIELLK